VHTPRDLERIILFRNSQAAQFTYMKPAYDRALASWTREEPGYESRAKRVNEAIRDLKEEAKLGCRASR
jgi:hypothetical protein